MLTEVPLDYLSHDSGTVSDGVPPPPVETNVETELKSHSSPRHKTLPVSGRGLKMLRHATDYLADEYALSALEAGSLDISDPRIEAIQILMEIYYSCPQAIPLWRRIVLWLLRSSVVCHDFDHVVHSRIPDCRIGDSPIGDSRMADSRVANNNKQSKLPAGPAISETFPIGEPTGPANPGRGSAHQTKDDRKGELYGASLGNRG